MAKDNRKKKKSCVPLDGYQAEQLARLIIAENRKEGALRHGKKETDCGTQRCRNSFLNATFLPISPSELFTDGTDGKPHNLITQENYEYLRDSFFRYALLMKKEAVHTPGRTPGESIARLHEEMCNLVGRT